MAEVKWSPEQSRIIDSRNRNLLVSAAAGAGKTTVLVERILGLISDEDLGIDVDRLLVVTFTKDAAAQMREKLGDRIEKLLETDPDNRRMQRQQKLLRNASIMTIDSFCNSVVKEYFHEIDIDPSFRIGQQAELKLLQNEVLSNLLEESYAEHNPNFIEMVETFCPSGKDDALEKLILRLNDAAEAQAWPEEWLDRLEAEFVAERDGQSGMHDDWNMYLTEYAHTMLAEIPQQIAEAVKLCNLDPVLKGYLVTFSSDKAFIDLLLTRNSYEEYQEAFCSQDFVRLATVRGECDEDVRSRIKAIRDSYKKVVGDLCSKYFRKTVVEINAELRFAAAPVVTLIGLAKEFRRRFLEVKKDRNILDFGDLEHFTLDILASKSHDGAVIPGPAAHELHERFAEIFVDEYQDSNFVQEQIIEIIAGRPDERPYTFMVGDVKQSIYKFRMAKPELFMNRFALYRSKPDAGEVISLGLNFRSRPEVLNSTNDVFYMCMQKGIGGIEYDGEAALVCGQNELAGGNMPLYERHRTEVILADGGDESDESDSGVYGLRMREAACAARRIRKLIASGYIIKEGEPDEHPIGYGDIVVLLRSVKDWADIYIEAFENEGIPSYSDSSAGFLESYEISAMLNYLRILDNPYQDIPLAAVLHSALGGFSSDDMVSIRTFGGMNTPFWTSLVTYAAEGPDERLKAAVSAFLSDYDEIRGMNLSRDIDRVIAAIYQRTGFYLYCSALPGGDRRASNLDMLMNYASDYEASSFSGLFSFVRYLEQIIESDQDLEEAVNAEVGNSVRIMSIHKSKGLEFPVVIIGGMGRKIMNMDGNQEVIISSDFGIATFCIDSKMRTRSKTLRRSVLQLMLKIDNLGEELRLLYVAMTRAKQKLIMIGAVSNIDARIDKWEEMSQRTGQSYPIAYIVGADCYFDLVYPVALRVNNDFTIIRTGTGALREGEQTETDASESNASSDIQSVMQSGIKALMEIGENGASGLRELLNYEYPYANGTVLPVKLSVSDIKRASLEEEGEVHYKYHPDNSSNESMEISGAERGTLYHKIMQLIPFTIENAEGVRHFLETLEKSGIITSKEREAVVPEDIAAFLGTQLCARMRRADALGKLRREQPFVLGQRACDIDPVKYSGYEEIIPVQGIIDCMFEEDGRYCILDYKTDRVSPEQGKTLADRYRIQLKNYADAVSRILGVRVDETVIYSFSLREVINV